MPETPSRFQPAPHWSDYVFRASEDPAKPGLKLLHDVPGCLDILCDAQHNHTAQVLADVITGHDAHCPHRHETPMACTITDYTRATVSLLGKPWYGSGSFPNAHGFLCGPMVDFTLYVDDGVLKIRDDNGVERALDICTSAETPGELIEQATHIADTIRGFHAIVDEPVLRQLQARGLRAERTADRDTTWVTIPLADGTWINISGTLLNGDDVSSTHTQGEHESWRADWYDPETNHETVYDSEGQHHSFMQDTIAVVDAVLAYALRHGGSRSAPATPSTDESGQTLPADAIDGINQDGPAID